MSVLSIGNKVSDSIADTFIDTSRWPVVACFRMGMGKPKLNHADSWIAKTDFELNNKTHNLAQRAYAVGRYIENSTTLLTDKVLASSSNRWLMKKISFLKKIPEKYMTLFCAASNKCRDVVGQEKIEIDAFAKEVGLVKEKEYYIRPSEETKDQKSPKQE